MIDYIWIITIQTHLDPSFTFDPLRDFCFTNKNEAIRYLKDLAHPAMETKYENQYCDDRGNYFYLHKLKVLDRWPERKH